MRVEIVWYPNDVYVGPVVNSAKAVYHAGFKEPNYPMPAIIYPRFEHAFNLGWVSALNGFPLTEVIKYTCYR